jgi:hypothetical protein
MSNVAKALREKHSEDTLHILIAKRNSGSFTYDGIELGGERVCQEIEEEIEKLAREGQEIKKLSVIGYSLGGLVARYAVGLLDSKGWFEKVEPVNFTTFATPHLGVRTPLKGYHNHVWNVLGARTLSMSGRQLFTIDNFRQTGRPLLSVLADPDSIFIKGLAKFKRRTLYANIVNDRSAVYYTTGISRNDPFTDLNNIKINYLEGYGDVIVNPVDPVQPKEPETELPALYRRVATSSQTFLSRLPLALALVIFIPIGVMAFLVNSGIQSVRSNRRIRLHEEGRAGIEIGNYRVPLLLNDMRNAVEDVYENLNSAQSNEYLASDTEDEALTDSAVAIRSKTSEKSGSASGSITSLEDAVNTHPLEASTLALAPYQFAMIQALDDVGWRKYPVHIHKVRHSHAAIIIRMNRASFDEGKIVLRHWLEEEFLI